jgi:hypothetical protein
MNGEFPKTREQLTIRFRQSPDGEVRKRKFPYPLTDFNRKPIVPLWGELTPRGNMVHQGIECENGVQDQLVLGSLKFSQDLRRT